MGGPLLPWFDAEHDAGLALVNLYRYVGLGESLMAAGTVRVHGLRELNKTFKHMGKEVQKETRNELREVGEPVRKAAEQLAAVEIRNIGDNWSKMRVGVTQKLVYVAPKARSRSGSPRPNLAGLLLQRAMLPALERNEPQVVAGLEKMLDRLADRNGF